MKVTVVLDLLECSKAILPVIHLGTELLVQALAI